MPREVPMLDAAAKAIAQMFSPPFRKILLKSAGIALLVVVVMAIGLHRVLGWFTDTGRLWLETTLGPSATTPLWILSWVITVAASLSIIGGPIVLIPAVTGPLV